MTWPGARTRSTAGAAYDQSNIHFEQFGQYGYINADRSVTPVNAYADGSQNAGAGESALDSRVNLGGRTRTWSLFCHRHAVAQSALACHLVGPLQPDRDQEPGQPEPGWRHRLPRRQPHLRPLQSTASSRQRSPAWNAYVGYSEGSRTPTSVELGCANPDNPCKLPNAMAGDPPLKQVVTKTWDLGLRGQLRQHCLECRPVPRRQP